MINKAKFRARITFVLPGRGLSGGVRVVVIYGNKLIERGHDVTIAVETWPLLWRPKALLERVHKRIGYSTGMLRDHLDTFKGRVITARQGHLAQALPEGDAVIATHWLTADDVYGLPSSKGKKFYFIQRYEADHFDGEKVDATWRLGMRKIVIAYHLRGLAEERFGDPNSRLVLNGVDHKQFHAPQRGLKNPPVVGFLYSPAPFKGVDVAVEAIRRARQILPKLKVVAFGAVRPTKALPLQANSEFYYQPPQDRLRKIYAHCDVWLCASRSEGFHLPPLEAMACRCPVVSTKVGGPVECVQPGINGYLVELEDAQGLAEGMVRVLSDPAKWLEMSTRAYHRSLEFDWDRSANEFESALLTDIDGKGNVSENTSYDRLVSFG